MGVSLMLSVVMAVVLRNPLSLVFGLTMPLFMMLPLLERIIAARHTRLERELEKARIHASFPPPALLAHEVRLGRRIPPWSARTSETSVNAQQLRVGTSIETGEVVLINPDGGVSITGPRAVALGMERSVQAWTLWMQSTRSSASDTEHDHARWLLRLDSDGHGSVIDRWALEPRRDGVLFDLMTEGELESLSKALSALAPEEAKAYEWSLFDNGPHALVSGVTGAGKTVFLRQWIRELLDSHDKVAIAIIDFKGGGAFAELAQDHRVRHLATNLDASSIEAALVGIRALLERREAHLARHACLELSGLPSDQRPPRAVIIVDEVRALSEAHPSAMSLFNDIAARGRALGVHLILSTQRFTSVAPPSLLANCALRVVFRAGDDEESRQLLGTTQAADARLASGTGFMRGAGGVVRPVRVESSDHDGLDPIQVGPSEPLWLEPLARGPRWSSVPGVGPADLVLGLTPRQRDLLWEPIRCNRERALILVVGGRGAQRTAIVHALAEQISTAVIGRNPNATWEALAPHFNHGSLAVEDLDTEIAGVPIAWREEFLERALVVMRKTLHAGGSVVVGLSRADSLLSRLAQLPHQQIIVGEHGTLHHAETGSPFTPVEPARDCTCSSRGETVIPALECHEDDVIISALPVPGAASASIVTPEAWMFGRTPRNTGGRVFVHSLTPSEARSLRLSAECVPPSRDGILYEVDESGRWSAVRYPSDDY